MTDGLQGIFCSRCKCAHCKDNLITTFSELATDRNDCYEYHCSCHGDKSDDTIKMGRMLFGDAIEYGKAYRIITKNSVCETTAYFMQYLAYLAAHGKEDYSIVLTDVSEKYESIKWSFIDFNLKNNMGNPHQQISYYILSRCL